MWPSTTPLDSGVTATSIQPPASRPRPKSQAGFPHQPRTHPRKRTIEAAGGHGSIAGVARKGGRRGKHGPNRSATRSKERTLHAVHSTDTPDDDLIGTLRTALRSKDPTAFTTLISSMLAVSDAWWREDDDPDADLDDDPDPVPLDALIELFVRTPYAETTAALHVVAALLPDELDATRVRRALTTRRHPVPLNVSGVRDIVVDHAAKIGDDLGDGDNLILGLTWPGIGGVTAVIYVDEAFGTRIKDVFLVPEPFDEVCARYREVLAEQGRRTSDLFDIDPGDARASIQHAIDRADAPDALPVPDDWADPDGDPLGWPTARPFVEMLQRRMPGGGTSVLTSSAQHAVSVLDAVRGFLGSPEAQGIDVAMDELEEAAFLIAGDAAALAGNPFRWSPVQVELALSQRLPWSPDATDAGLGAVDEVLPAFIRYAHRRLEVSPEATVETLAAVNEWLPTFEVLCAAAPAGSGAPRPR